MTYEELSALKKGARIQLQDGRNWEKATFCAHGNTGGNTGAWIAFDKRQREPGTAIQTFITTGLQFTPEYFKQQDMGRKLRALNDEELNAELVESMSYGQA